MSASEVSQKHVAENPPNIYLWVVVGCSAVGATALLALIVIIVYLRHRKSILKDPEGSFQSASLKRSESSPSTGFDECYPAAGRKSSLSQSTSIDIPSSMVHLTRECIQPRQLHRWYTIPPCQYDAVALGEVEPDLSKGSDDEQLDETPNTNGRLWFSLEFHQDQLQVFLIKAKYLTGRGFNNAPRDPYVKVYLLPDEENFQQSKVKKRTLAPKFQETFLFQVKEEELPRKAVRFSVYDIDRRKIRHCLGHVVFPLVQMTANEVICRDLENVSQQSASLGELQISLSCNHLSNRIKSSVCKLRNVRGIDAEHAAFYVKVQLSHGRKIMKTKRTDIQRLDPKDRSVTFEDHFCFAVSGRYYDSCSLTFTVMVAGPNPLLKDEPYGTVVIGPFMYSRGEQMLHWQEMLSNPRSMVTRWHCLEEMHPCS